MADLAAEEAEGTEEGGRRCDFFARKSPRVCGQRFELSRAKVGHQERRAEGGTGEGGEQVGEAHRSLRYNNS